MTEFHRIYDRGRDAFFCDVDKQGNALPLPPRQLEPRRSETNPRGVRHPGKTKQDRQPVNQRQRVKDHAKRVEAMQS
jgi:hypothetical protein